MLNIQKAIKYITIAMVINLVTASVYAQTDIDALMMDKKNFCGGVMYNYSSWKNYWEGSFKRDNANLGTVSNQSIGIMGNYGWSEKLNLLFSLPYVQTKASAGTLKGMKGFQDLSLFIKYMPLEKNMLKGTVSLYAIGGYSMPVSNYVADYLPLSIGMQSKTLTARLMADYQKGNYFITTSATYNYRNNIELDRTAYYTTQMHLTNEVAMPDVFSYNIRTGYRSALLIAEFVYNNMITQDGFDIRKNDMPFPSNQMNLSTAGLNIKYTFKARPALSITGGGNTTLTGRNVGQSTSFYGGLFYILDFSVKHQNKDAKGKHRNANR